MRQKRSQSAPVRAQIHRRLTGTPSTLTDHPRSYTARSTCRPRVCRRLWSAMSGSGVGSAADIFSDISLDTPGLFIWRLEGRRMCQVDVNDHGFFFEGTSYIVLKITTDGTSFLHFWNGRLATETDSSFIQDLVNELDVHICRAQVLSKEVQSHESLSFLRLFPDGVVYLEGGPHASLSRTAHYVRKLYVVTGRKHVRAACNKPTVTALDSSLAVILDGFPRVYVWIGSRCSYVTRVKAIQVARRIRNWQRKGKAHIVVVDEKDEALNTSFLKKLDGETERSVVTQINGHCPAAQTDNHEDTVVLHRVSGERVLYDMPFAARKPLYCKYLISTSSYLLDTGPDKPLHLWVGSRAHHSDIDNAITRGQAFCEYKSYPEHLSVCRVMEGHESLQFRQAFNEWREKPSKLHTQTKKYSAGNMGRALFSRSSKRAVAKISDWESDDLEREDNLTYLIYVLKGTNLEFVKRSDYGTFSVSHCYVVDCKILEDENCSQRIVYYWLGSRSTAADRDRMYEIVMGAYHDLAAIMRVLDGKEPQQFMHVLGNAIGVFDKSLEKGCHPVQLYTVREYLKENIRVTQVAPVASSLNSSVACVLKSADDCFLWYGKESGGPEREYAKHIFGCLNPDKIYDYDILTETKETETFWELLGGRNTYEEKYQTTTLERRRPRLFFTSDEDYEEIVDFDQEDICEEDVMLLDTFDQIFVWYGANKDIRDRTQIIATAEHYLKADQAGRRTEDVQIWYLCQNMEPYIFTKHFRSWQFDNFGGKEAYNQARKRVRQENARIDVSTDIFGKSHVIKTKYPYKTLVKGDLPPDVDPAQKEHHLSDKQFSEVLRISRFQFYQLPEWKQSLLLKMAHLTSGQRISTSASSEQSSLPLLSLPQTT